MRPRIAFKENEAFATGSVCDMTLVCARIGRTRRHITLCLTALTSSRRQRWQIKQKATKATKVSAGVCEIGLFIQDRSHQGATRLLSQTVLSVGKLKSGARTRTHSQVGRLPDGNETAPAIRAAFSKSIRRGRLSSGSVRASGNPKVRPLRNFFLQIVKKILTPFLVFRYKHIPHDVRKFVHAADCFREFSQNQRTTV
jgi:hypothetical protein